MVPMLLWTRFTGVAFAIICPLVSLQAVTCQLSSPTPPNEVAAPVLSIAVPRNMRSTSVS